MQDEKNRIISSVENFIKSADNSDLKLLDHTLHDSFLNIQNGFFEKKGIFTIDKEKYLQLVTEHTFGGIPRKMDIVSVDIHGGIAMVKAELESEQLKFISFISLVLDEDAKWKVVGNLPHIMLI